jgi:hypothetical protein
MSELQIENSNFNSEQIKKKTLLESYNVRLIQNKYGPMGFTMHSNKLKTKIPNVLQINYMTLFHQFSIYYSIVLEYFL